MAAKEDEEETSPIAREGADCLVEAVGGGVCRVDPTVEEEASGREEVEGELVDPRATHRGTFGGVLLSS